MNAEVKWQTMRMTTASDTARKAALVNRPELLPSVGSRQWLRLNEWKQRARDLIRSLPFCGSFAMCQKIAIAEGVYAYSEFRNHMRTI